MLNFAAIASDAGAPAATVREYYYLLEDTLVGFRVPAWTRSRRRRAISTPKFYLFDTGITTRSRAQRRSTGTRTSTAGASSTGSAWSSGPI